MSENKREGEISKQSIEPHYDIVRENDQLLHEPENAGDAAMSDTQESLTERRRLLVRTKSALKLEITCEHTSLQEVGAAVERAGAEVLQAEPEYLAKQIEEALDADGHGTVSRLQFIVPGCSGRIVLCTHTPTEEEVVGMFEAAGWTIFDISRDAAF